MPQEYIETRGARRTTVKNVSLRMIWFLRRQALMFNP